MTNEIYFLYMYIICICVQRQVRCQKNRCYVYVTHLGSLSGNHGSEARRRRKGHRSLFSTLYTSGIFLSHSYTISTYLSFHIRFHPCHHPIYFRSHALFLCPYTSIPITSSPRSPQSNPTDEKKILY